MPSAPENPSDEAAASISGWFTSLPWYDLEELRPATDRLWQRLAAALVEQGIGAVPDRLDRKTCYVRQWRSGRLLFGQACGYDVRIAAPEHLQVVATPCYTAPGCSGASYSSVILVRATSSFEGLDDLRGTRCVINQATSHSGMNILRAMIAPLHHQGRFFGSVTLTGSHEGSIEQILAGAADVAAIDCVTYALLARHRPDELAGTRVLARTAQIPAPPFVTSRHLSGLVVDRLRAALRTTLADASLQDVRSELLIDGVQLLSASAYDRIHELEEVAKAHGYDLLAEAE